MKFRPDIEGLRALAIVPVVVYHAWPTALPGGFVGVDVFFVISGYLITTLLLQRLSAGQYSIASFYAARIRRIFPALFVMLALTVPAAVMLLDPKALAEFARLVGATGLFVSNIELYRTTGYFERAADLKPLLHTWSLAVEEQYYIVFPLFLVMLYRCWRRGLGMALLVVGLVSFVYCEWLLRHDAALAFYSNAARTFELMIGSGLAWWVGRPRASVGTPLPRMVVESLAFLGLLAVAWSAMFLRADSRFPGLNALLPCAGAALLIWTGGQGSSPCAVARFLAWAPLRWIGAMSFSLYLWHWPVLVFSHHALLGPPSAMQAGLAVLIAIGLAWASLRFVEAPTRRSAWTQRSVLAAGLLSIGLSLLAGFALLRWAQHIGQQVSPANHLLAGAHDFSPIRERCHGRERVPLAFENRCRLGPADAPQELALWGDSHGVEIAKALGDRAPSGYVVTQFTAAACPPSVGFVPKGRDYCRAHNERAQQGLLADERITTVLIVARTPSYLAGSQAAEFRAGLLEAVRRLRQAGKRVLLLDPVPDYPYPVPAALAQLARRGLDPASLGHSVEAASTQLLSATILLQQIADQTGAERVQVLSALCPNGRCAVIDADLNATYTDSNHLSVRGAQLLVPVLHQAIAEGGLP